MADRDTNVRELCTEIGVSVPTLYRHVAPDGKLRERGRQVMGK